MTRRADTPTVLRLYALAVLGPNGAVVEVQAPYYRPEDAHEAAALRLLSRFQVTPFTLIDPGGSH